MAAPQPRLTLGTASSSAAAALALKASYSANAAPAAQRTSSFFFPSAVVFPTTTTSSFMPEVAEGRHVFDVHQYSFLKNLGVGKSVRSGTFDVGGHTWALLFFPAGSEAASGGQRHVSVYLQLMTPHVEVWALFDLRLLDQSTGRWHSLFDDGVESGRRQAAFSTFPSKRPPHHPPRCWGVPSWKASNLETPKYVQNDSLTIRCDITVIKPPRLPETKQQTQIEPPPPGLSKDLARLLEKDGKDVTVRIGREAFPAHRTMLAARSPVLRKKLLDATDETNPQTSVEITMDNDMEPTVFKAMLHFIYTDELPPDAGGDEAAEFLRRLVIAAEECGIERLKGLCESLLCRNLNKRTLKDTMEFAGRHRCDKLSKACVAVLGNLRRGLEGAGDSEACKRLKKN